MIQVGYLFGMLSQIWLTKQKKVQIYSAPKLPAEVMYCFLGNLCDDLIFTFFMVTFLLQTIENAKSKSQIILHKKLH